MLNGSFVSCGRKPRITHRSDVDIGDIYLTLKRSHCHRQCSKKLVTLAQAQDLHSPATHHESDGQSQHHDYHQHETLSLNKGDYPKFVHHFRHASPYIEGHRGRTFIIVVPGEVS